MGKLPDWVNKPDSTDETYIWFPSNMNPVDLLWAKAEKQTKANNSGDKKVDFTFNHATARFGFDITAPELLENSAVITVDNVQLYCESNGVHIGVFDMVGYLNLKTGGWQVVNDEKLDGIILGHHMATMAKILKDIKKEKVPNYR